MDGLVIREPWIDMILTGKKIWEIRSGRTHKRGRIALIRSGSGQVVGTCQLDDVKGPLTLNQLRKGRQWHGIASEYLSEGLPYEKTYAWVLKQVKPLRKPVPYKHPQGAVIWVKLSKSVLDRI